MNTVSALGLAGGAALALCQYLVFVHAPVEQTMGIAQKIFYFHLPVAWWCFVSFFTACVAGLAYLRSRRAFWDHLEHAAAEWGLVLTTLALVTGSIWGRCSWGVWWTWDPRLTTTLVLWFIYAAYLVLRSAGISKAVCAVIAAVGFLDVPLVFFSARLWRSIHPAVFARKGGGLEPEMAIAVIAMVLCFGLIWAAVLICRTKQLALSGTADDLAASEDE
ncbi:MAG: cytochrome c biogenesis protein CcsA [Mailhella sp.]|nr:cytochrome c biogenesis protein CcsA [Mailhella sp.]